jgi:hypothetical protein
MTNHEELMRRTKDLLDAPEDVVAAILDELAIVAAASGLTLDAVYHIGYQDFAGREFPDSK